MDAGRARVVVEADTGLADAAFKKLQADAARAMDAIGRQRAEAEVNAKTTGFDRAIDNVKRRIAELDGTTANPNVDINSAEAQAELAALRAELKKLGSERATIRVDAKELKDANRLRDISAKKQAAMSKAYLDEEKAVERAAKARERATTSEARQIRQMGVMQERAARDDAKRTEEGIKNVERLARARRDYGKVLGDVQRLETKTGRPGGIFRTSGETRELEATRAKASALAREIEHLGGNIADIDPDLERNQGLFGRWASSVSKTRVQLGFFSTTIAQAGKGLVGLGPILTGLGGGLISVVGVLGSGIAGAGAVGAAGLAGFIGAAIGTVAVVKPMVKEFEEAHKASENLTKAQKEYGKGSTQAKTAQEKFNHIMAGTSPAAKAAIKDYGNITGQWKSLTAAAKPAVFNAFGQGIRTVQALLPDFAKQSVATTKVAGHAFEGWMKSLRSPEAKQLLNSVLSNFRASIPGIADGLGSLGAAFGRIMASASKSLPSLSRGFENWADSVEKSVGGGDALDNKIQNMVHNMQDLGHLTQDTGSLLMHVFGASSKSGDDLVDSLDRVITRWDTWTQSAQGQDSLKSFFGEARTETEQFFSAMAPLTRLLFQMSRAFAPITSGALDAVQVVGDFVQVLTKLPGLKVGLEGVGGVLAGMWAVGKVKAFAGAISGAAGALKGLVAAEGASGGLASLLGGRGAAKGASALKRDGEVIATIGTTAVASEAEVGALGATIGTLALPLAAVAAPFVALTLAVGTNGEALEEAKKAWQDSKNVIPQAIAKLTGASNTYVSAQQKRAGVSRQLAGAEKHLVKLMGENAPYKQRAQLVGQINRLESEQARAVVKTGQSLTTTVAAAKTNLAAAKERVATAKEEIRLGNEKPKPGVGVTASAGRAGFAGNAIGQQVTAERAELAAKGYHNLSTATHEVAEQQRQLALTMIPVNRELAGQAPITEKTYQGLKKLSTTIGGVATKKIGKFVDPQDVAKVTQLGNRLTKLGQGSTVKKIAVKSSGADETINKLQRVNKQSQRVQQGVTRLKVTADDGDASNKLRRVSQLAQKVLGTKAILRILGNSSNAEEAAHKAEHAMRQAAANKYQAEISGIDKTHGPLTAAQQHLIQVARQKYEARISAIDNASNPARTAKSNLDKIKDKHATITVTGAQQAAGEASSVATALDKIHDASATITTTYVQHGNPPSGGRYMGGPAAYTSSYAMGGRPTDQEVQRAAQRADRKAGGSGGVINKPTMLVGEQAPTYNEFVITENPAYRTSNMNYLEQAAGSLGRELIPAYKKGKGGDKKNNNKGSKNKKDSGPQVPDGGIKDPGPAPKLNSHIRKWHEPTEVNHGKGIELHNRLVKDAELEEGAYQNELAQEEREISVYKKTGQGRSGWDFAKFKKIREAILKDAKQIKSSAIPKEIEDVEAVEKTASGVWANANGEWETSRENLAHGNKRLHKMETAYNHMQRNKHESQKDYSNKRLKFKAEIEAQKKENDDWKARKKALEDKKKEARKTEIEAKKEIKSLQGASGREATNTIDAAQNELSELLAQERGELDTPYAESEEPKTAKETAEEQKEIAREAENNEREGLEARIVEQELAGPSHTQQLKEARENLLNWDYGALARAQGTPENRDDLEALNNIRSDKEVLEGDAAGGTAKSIGEETATLSGARQALYEQFASNITATNGAGPTPSGGYPAGALPKYTQDVLNELAANKTVGGGFAGVGPTPIGQTGVGSTHPASGGTVMNVTNNFSTPPPDPHTFSKNLTFELNAG